jgi:ParB/RepB/Spo0J family partition protein
VPSIAEIAAKKAEQAAQRETAKPGDEKPAKHTPHKAPAPPAVADPAAVAEARTVGKLSDVSPNPLNPRNIDPESADMRELRADLKTRGQMTPVAVVTADHFRRIFEGTPHVSKIGRTDFVIIGGGRRYVALKANRAGTVKFTVLHGKEAPSNPAEWLAATVAENIQREDLSVMETARSVRDLRQYNSGREVADILHKSPGWVSQYLGLNDLPAEVIAVIESAPFSLRQARRVYDRSTAAARLREAERIRAEILGDEAPDTDPGDEPAGDGGNASKGGRKAHTPAQKLTSTLAKHDRDTIVEALAARFAVSAEALAALLVEPAAAGDDADSAPERPREADDDA